MKGIVRTSVLTAFATLVVATAGVWAAEIKITEEENTLLALVLKRSYPDSGYTVVDPETTLSLVDWDDAAEIKERKQYIAEHLETNGIVVTKLVDRLFDRNRKPGRLTLGSSPTNGYVIDFDGRYAKYFRTGGGGWEKWNEENPKARGSTTVSLPVYDKKAGLVLVYTGTSTGNLAGSGWIILYRYEKGELKELNRVMMWIS